MLKEVSEGTVNIHAQISVDAPLLLQGLDRLLRRKSRLLLNTKRFGLCSSQTLNEGLETCAVSSNIGDVLLQLLLCSLGQSKRKSQSACCWTQ